MQYLSVSSDRRKLYVTEVGIDSKLHYRIVDNFKPEILTDSSNEDSEWRSLFGNHPLTNLTKDSIQDWYEYKRAMERIDNVNLFNVIDPEYQYIRQEYYGKHESFKARFWYLDIETGLGPNNSFPNPMEATAPITLIQIAESDTGMRYIFGTEEYESTDPNLKFMYCETEKQMLDKFVQFFHMRTPAVTTAWNGDIFDFPFIVNRLAKIGYDPSILSPFGKMEKHRVNMWGTSVEIEKPLGVNWLDYIECYKKAIPGGKESWTLEYISKYELGEEEGGKMDYTQSGFASMKDFILKNYDPEKDILNTPLKTLPKDSPEWNRAWYELFVDYGDIDVVLLMKMDNKINSLNSLISLAHSYGCNVYDTFATVKPWQIYIYNSLYEQKKALPLKSPFETYKFQGGYVYANPGIHKWVISEDYASLYPFCVMSMNLSPETQIPHKDVPHDLKEATKSFYRAEECEDIYIALPLEQKQYIASLLKKYNYSMTPNGCFWDRSYYGILPTLNKQVYSDRKFHKKEMKKYENMAEELKRNGSYDEKEYESLRLNASQHDTLQYTKKIQINAMYGAAGNAHSMFANADMAAAITAYGRLNIKMTSDYIVSEINKMSPDFNMYIVQNDTDSGYFSLESIVKAWDTNNTKTTPEIVEFIDQFIKKFIQPKIDESAAYIADLCNAYENSLEMDREIIADVMVSTGKKRYTARIWDNEGVRLTTPKKKIVGLEIKRSDTPADVRSQLDKVIDLLFEGDNQVLVDYIQEYELNHKYVDLEKIAIPSGISDISKYAEVEKGIPIHVRAAKVMNQLVLQSGKESDYPLVVNGDKIKYLFLKTPNPIKSDVIAFKDPRFISEFGLVKYVDFKRLFERTFISPVETLTEAIGWKLNTGDVAMMDLF